MNYQQKLEELLDRYIEENKRQRDTYNKDITLKELYEELLSYLKDEPKNIEENKILISFLLSSIYKDNIYLNEFYSLLVNLEQSKDSRRRYRQLVNIIKEDYKKILNEIIVLENQLSRNKHLVSSANKAKLSFKYHSPIAGNKYDIINIKRIINYFEMSGVISNKEELLLLNEIELYNRRVNIKGSNTDEQNYADNLYNEIPNILNAGYQEHDKVEVSEDKKDTLDKIVKGIFEYVTVNDDADITEAIESYYNYNLDSNEYNYIIVKLLDSYLDELMTFYELLIDRDIYTKRSDRIQIVKKYYSVLDKYLYLREYYNKTSNEMSLNEMIEENSEDTEKLSEGSKKLIYASNNAAKSRLISDMGDIPYEYYNTVKELLDGFKNNTLSNKEIKPITNKDTKDYLELKYDQVRIVIKHIKDDIYAVMGAFVKKDDNDRNTYKNIFNRIVPSINNENVLNMYLELAKNTEESLQELVETKGRKGTR